LGLEGYNVRNENANNDKKSGFHLRKGEFQYRRYAINTIAAELTTPINPMKVTMSPEKV
jgi:hypothetical protein